MSEKVIRNVTPQELKKIRDEMGKDTMLVVEFSNEGESKRPAPKKGVKFAPDWKEVEYNFAKED